MNININANINKRKQIYNLIKFFKLIKIILLIILLNNNLLTKFL